MITVPSTSLLSSQRASRESVVPPVSGRTGMQNIVKQAAANPIKYRFFMLVSWVWVGGREGGRCAWSGQLQNALTRLAMVVSFSSKSVQDEVTQDLERTDTRLPRAPDEN